VVEELRKHRIERARPQFPAGVERISMWSEDADQIPLAWFGLLHEGNSDRNSYLIEKVVTPRLEAVRGVSKVDVWGALQDSVRILLDEDKVTAAQLDLGELIRRLSTDNFAQPLGEIDDGGRQILLRSDMRFRSAEEIAAFPVGDGLRLSDLADVRPVKSVQTWLSRVNGSYSYTGMITKDSQVNVVDATHNLRAAIEEIEKDPAVAGELEFLIFWAPGDVVESSLGQLQETAAWGGALALVVLFVFLRRVRLTLCVALSIPVSALLALAWEYFGGGSFNILTMTGITMATGMLVDNSVVVVENIARFRRQGMDGVSAARAGAREIALAVTLATLTTVVVFAPLMFVSDIPLLRLAFIGIGRPLCISLIFSLIVALVFLPVIAARLVGDRPRFVEAVARRIDPLAKGPVGVVALAVGALRWCSFHLSRLLQLVARGAYAVLVLPVRVALAGGALWLAYRFLAETRPSLELAGELAAATGTSADAVSWFENLFVGLAAAAVAALLLLLPFVGRRLRAPRRPQTFVPRGKSLVEMVVALNAHLIRWTLRHRVLASIAAFAALMTIVVPNSQTTFAAFGQDEDTTQIGFFIDFEADFTLAEAADEMAIYERLVETRREEYGFENWSCRFSRDGGRFELYWEDRLTPQRMAELRRELRTELPHLPGHRVQFYDDESTNTRLRNLAFFHLRGPDSRVLERLGPEAVAALEGVPGLGGVSSPLENAPDVLEVEIDRDLALNMSVPSETALNTIAYTLRGWPLPRFYDEGREVPLIIEYDTEKVAGIGTLRDLRVWNGSSMVPLSSFSKIRATKGDREIRRVNGQTTFTITAEVEDPTRVMEITDAGNAALGTLELPRGYSFGLEDTARFRQAEEFGQLIRMLILSMVLVFLLMGILFESWLLPLSVLFTIPFAVLGAMWTVFVTGIAVDTMGLFGLIILVGVVVNNGIVLIDRIHGLVRAGVERSEAVVEGCAQRVRPILMTALTTVSGLLPMALSQPATNAFSYQSLATLVAGGLLVSTFFTLWVVPLAYTLLDDLAKWFLARWAWATRRASSRVVATSPG